MLENLQVQEKELIEAHVEAAYLETDLTEKEQEWVTLINENQQLRYKVKQSEDQAKTQYMTAYRLIKEVERLEKQNADQHKDSKR